jgi:hypothetical protein
MNKQIVITRSLQGFADRLQILSDAIEYCKRNDAALCVDWRDVAWGQTDKNFDDYFDLIKVESVTIEQVVQRLQEGATIYPDTWNAENIREPMTKVAKIVNGAAKFNGNYKKLNYDIIIIADEDRTFHISNMIVNIRLKPDIQNIIIEKIRHLILPYTCIYIRGTDRLKIDPEEAIDSLIQKYDNLLPFRKEQQCYVLSDMIAMIEKLKEKIEKAEIACPDNVIYKLDRNNMKGTHFIDKKVLAHYGLTKHEMNISTITDFIILAMAETRVTNETKSIFYGMSEFIYNLSDSEGIGLWLGGFTPNGII